MSVRRMEIITGTGRRRNWPAAMREQIVSETLAADATVTDVARRHDIDRSLVYRWRRALGVTRRVREAGGFVPVEVFDAPVAATTSSRLEAANRSERRVEIALICGRRIFVDTGVDAEALGRIVAVLDRR